VIDSTDEAGIYRELVHVGARRLLGALDRDRTSDTAGCFDRDHWAWKFRDFPLTMLQAGAYPLAQLWALSDESPYGHNERLLEWITSALEYTCRQQHKSGGFDSVAPNTRDLGVSLAMAHFLWRSFECIADAAPGALESTVRDTVTRACRFASRTEEDYAFIANHRALFALGFVAGAEAADDAGFSREAARLVAEIVERQSPGGSFPEYGGFDPGYETLGISYLASYWKLTGDPSVLEPLSRSVRKLSYTVHPDGSVGGRYGSRQTRLYFPAGMEILASRVTEAAAIAGFMRRRLSAGNVVTPANVDIHNLPVLLASYMEARRARALASAPTDAPPPLPCETLEGIRHLDGLTVVGSKTYYALAAADQGGLLQVFERPSGRSLYEEGGYLIADGRQQWCSAGALGERHGDDASTWTCEVPLVERRSEVPTPTKFVVLRLLNLTLFRSLWAGRIIRRAIVRRLTTDRRPGPFRLRRDVCFEADRIEVRDEITTERRGNAPSVLLPRELMPYHMGSANYFHRSSLAEGAEPPLEDMARGLRDEGRGKHEFVLSFVLPAEEAITGNADPPTEADP
jgi:hypothetical protein